ncbi:MAG: DUF5106 domain-containing protein [Bacteroidales bacterium]|nr:DUF5106 domain-containing protein [Bacteroidales bacterium]
MEKGSKIVLYLIFVITVAFGLLPAEMIAQNAYQIRFDLKNQKDSVYILARYYGDKVQLVDSVQYYPTQKVIFEGQEKLPGGIYILATGKKVKLLEFVVADNQHFTLSADFSDQGNQLNANGEKENTIFFENLMLSNKAYAFLEEKRKLADAGTITQNAYKQLADSVSKVLNAFKLEAASDEPGLFITKLFRSMEETVIPPEFEANQEKMYLYYKQHYWDNVDLTDERMLRTPVFSKKIEAYFKNVIPPIPDSVITGIDSVIGKAGSNKVMRDYLIWYFTGEYQNPSIMGMDKVFVHLADTYFAHESISNATESVKKKITERADVLRSLLIGKTAPDLWLMDTAGVYRSFREINAGYLVLFFWDHDCNVCKQELDELNKLFSSKKYPIEVYAIGTNSKLDGWKDYIIRHNLGWHNVTGTRSLTPDFHDVYDIYGTPVIYLLDKQKTIIAKRIKAEQISLVIDNQRGK